ncbi:MAG: DNA repair protein RecO [Bacteroidetes bacterium]|nr:DNA repair protein RecO [Bacteroidota bacterium]MBP6314601.1 DNA repair protein RecO [Chitinophagaceae bacterium]
MIHASKGIVLRVVKYGETSIIVSVYTELFGLQSYMINGARTEKKTAVKANLYQPGTLLDLIVYHHPHKNLHRIKEAKLQHSTNFQGAEVIKYTIGIYMVELIQKAITETESNPELYQFFEESFMQVLHNPIHHLSNFPIEFTLKFAEQLGFGIHNNYSAETPIFELQNGNFVSESDTGFQYTMPKDASAFISSLCSHSAEAFPISGAKRLEILNQCIQYLRLHIPHLGELKSVQILHEILH